MTHDDVDPAAHILQHMNVLKHLVYVWNEGWKHSVFVWSLSHSIIVSLVAQGLVQAVGQKCFKSNILKVFYGDRFCFCDATFS